MFPANDTLEATIFPHLSLFFFIPKSHIVGLPNFMSPTVGMLSCKADTLPIRKGRQRQGESAHPYITECVLSSVFLMDERCS
jgi:hypothetical protein